MNNKLILRFIKAIVYYQSAYVNAYYKLNDLGPYYDDGEDCCFVVF